LGLLKDVLDILHLGPEWQAVIHMVVGGILLWLLQKCFRRTVGHEIRRQYAIHKRLVERYEAVLIEMKELFNKYEKIPLRVDALETGYLELKHVIATKRPNGKAATFGDQ
jgi:hypothetical protein